MMSDERLSLIENCVDCRELLHKGEFTFECTGCGRVYKQVSGVWDFRETAPRLPQPALFHTPEYLEWRVAFEERELKNWYIYKNALFRFFSQAGHRLVGKALKRKPRNGPLLEIGAGSGALLNFFPANRYVGVDIALEGLVELKLTHPDAVAVCASTTALPFKTSSFEQIICLHTLEHIYHLAEALEEIVRMMRPECIFHYGIPTEGGIGFWLGRKMLTGPHVWRTYGLDIDHIMDREHVNDAPRVIKFLRMHFGSVQRHFWPLGILPFLSINALIYGTALIPSRQPEKNHNDF
jgi:SAM-dependent methyltransferase